MSIMNNKESMQLYLRLNRTIMDIALRGNTDSLECMDLYWTTINRHTFAYIEDLKTETFFFRVFKCDDKTLLSRHALLYPDYKDEKLVCLYDCSERKNVRTILHCKDFAAWHKEAMLSAGSISDFADYYDEQ